LSLAAAVGVGLLAVAALVVCVPLLLVLAEAVLWKVLCL